LGGWERLNEIDVTSRFQIPFQFRFPKLKLWPARVVTRTFQATQEREPEANF